MTVETLQEEQFVLSVIKYGFVSEEFLVMLAHKLRNSLAPIMNSIYIVEKSSANGNQLVRNATNVLSRQVGYLVGTIDDLIDIARIARKDMQLVNSRVEVCSMIREVVEECQSIFNSRKHLIEVALPDKSVWVQGDKQKLHKILTHFMVNATKFTGIGGKISVTMAYSSERVMVNVKDTGIGMSQEAMSQVFTLFSHQFLGDSMRVSLPLSQELAVLHGGTIEAFSEGIGHGSEFSLILPILEVSDPVGAIPKKFVTNTNEKCLDIMVVDDHLDTAESLAILLKMWGHVVRVCHNGTAAVQMAKINTPDVVLLDIGLPDCDGYQVAKKLKEEMPSILLIAITGYGQKVDRKRSTLSGFKHHLVKPVIHEKLKEALFARE